MRWFFFPHAGGSSAAYRQFRGTSKSSITHVEYPGRGARWSEKSVGSIPDLATLCVNEHPIDVRDQVAIFGHSFGALVGFEFACQLRESFGIEVALLIASASDPPWLLSNEKKLHAAPDSVLIGELSRLGGTPTEILESNESLELILPAYRADLRAYETYVHSSTRKLKVPLVSIGGHQDGSVKTSSRLKWREATTGSFLSKSFSGGHFYLFEGDEFKHWFHGVLMDPYHFVATLCGQAC